MRKTPQSKRRLRRKVSVLNSARIQPKHGGLYSRGLSAIVPGTRGRVKVMLERFDEPGHEVPNGDLYVWVKHSTVAMEPVPLTEEGDLVDQLPTIPGCDWGAKITDLRARVKQTWAKALLTKLPWHVRSKILLKMK